MPNAPVILDCVAGCSVDFARATPNDDGGFGGVYTGAEAITVTIRRPGATACALRRVGPPGNAWIDAARTAWIVGLDDAQTAAIGPGTFDMIVTAPIAPGRTGVLFDGQLVVQPGPGTDPA